MATQGLFAFVWRLMLLSCCLGLDVPSTWRAPSFKSSRADRISVAQHAMDQVAQNVSTATALNGFEPWQAAPVLASMAVAEIAMGTTRYHSQIGQVLAQINANPDYETSPYNDLNLSWGITTIYAYLAYKDQAFLSLAEQAWNTAFTYFITEQQAASGKHPTRNITFKSICIGHSTAGGVFFVKSASNSSDTQILPKTVGQFSALSAHLAEATGNSTYADAALLSATFLRNLMIDPSGLIYFDIELDNCSITQVLQSLNSGYAIHAWSVVADVSKDDQWRVSALKTLVASTVTSVWAKPDGIVTVSATEDATDDVIQSYKGLFVGSFYEPWARNAANASIRAYIEAYIATQYNALQDLATKPGSFYYSADWHGPAVDYWTKGGVMASTPVLAMAVAPGGNISTSTTTSSAAGSTGSEASHGSGDTTSGDTNTTSTKHGASVGVIVGAVFATIAAIVGLGICLLIARRRQRRPPMPAAREETDDFVDDNGVAPTDKAETYTMTPSLPRTKRQEAGFAPEFIHPPSQPQSEAGYTQSGNVASPSSSGGPGSDVNGIVELVYQRLQAERPAYSEDVHGLPAYTDQAAGSAARPSQY